MTPTLSLPLPLMNQITISNFVAISGRMEYPEIASAENYGKLSVWV